MNPVQIILLLIYSFIAGMGSVLDEAQTHRPLVACTVVGLIMGDLKTAIILGSTLELMSLGWINVGLAIGPDTAIASILSTIVVLSTNTSYGQGIALAVPLAAAGQVLTIFVRTITVFLVHQADEFAKRGKYHGIEAMHLVALCLQGLRVLIPTALVLMLNVSATTRVLNAIPKVITEGLQVGGGMIVVVGYAMVINMMDTPRLKPFFYMGFLLAAFTKFNLVGFGAMGVVLAVLYVQLKDKTNKTAAPAGVDEHRQKDDDLDDDLDE